MGKLFTIFFSFCFAHTHTRTIYIWLPSLVCVRTHEKWGKNIVGSAGYDFARTPRMGAKSQQIIFLNKKPVATQNEMKIFVANCGVERGAQRAERGHTHAKNCPSWVGLKGRQCKYAGVCHLCMCMCVWVCVFFFFCLCEISIHSEFNQYVCVCASWRHFRCLLCSAQLITAAAALALSFSCSLFLSLVCCMLICMHKCK